MTFSRKSPSKIVKFQRDLENEKKVGGIPDFEQNMCRKGGSENPIKTYHTFLSML